MPYYDSIAEDLKRAKEILEHGRRGNDRLVVSMHEMLHVEAAAQGAGAIMGADTYAAYKLLESFVGEIERLTLENTRSQELARLLNVEVERLQAFHSSWTFSGERVQQIEAAIKAEESRSE